MYFTSILMQCSGHQGTSTLSMYTKCCYLFIYLLNASMGVISNPFIAGSYPLCACFTVLYITKPMPYDQLFHFLMIKVNVATKQKVDFHSVTYF